MVSSRQACSRVWPRKQLMGQKTKRWMQRKVLLVVAAVAEAMAVVVAQLLLLRLLQLQLLREVVAVEVEAMADKTLLPST